MTITQNVAHAEEAIAQLIEFFRHGPRNQALLRALAQPFQDLEDAFWQLYTERTLDEAYGATLDILGRIVGEQRDDRGDAPYRTAIRVRILVNSSNGALPELLTILETALPSLTSIGREYYPAAVLFRWLDSFTDIDAEDLMRLIRQAKPAGVSVQAVIRNDTTGFRWSTVANAGAATTRAFASVAGGNGGLLERVLR